MNKKILISCIAAVILLACCAVLMIMSSGSKIEESEAKLHYMNIEYVNTGNETLDKTIAVTKKVNYVKAGDLMKAMILELANNPDGSKYYTGLKSSIVLIDTEVKNDLACVNFAKTNLEGSSTEEEAIIEQVTNTIFDNFDYINKVQFLVDGEEVESLMGHFSAGPFYRKKVLTMDDVKIGSISIGDSEQVVKANYHEPVNSLYEQGTDIVELEYEDLAVLLEKEVVKNIVVKTDKISTSKGLKIGDSVEQVKTFYGEPYSETKDMLMYMIDDVYLNVSISDGKVSRIEVIKL